MPTGMVKDTVQPSMEAATIPENRPTCASSASMAAI